MRLPTPLSRTKRNVHKNTFGHLLVIAGSGRMTGAACLTGLAALRSGCGLVTLAVPKGINATVHKKCAHELMTLPLPQTRNETIASNAFPLLKKSLKKSTAVAIGPGLSQDPQTLKFILKIIETVHLPMVIDADALNALAGHLSSLRKGKTARVLTPHPGEMSRLTKSDKTRIEANRRKTARDFARKYNCVLLLKGHRTVIASPQRTTVNTTGNPGMATAGSGDVLTGVIGSFLAQGLSAYDAAKFGAYIHGKAGDCAARTKGRVSLIASDIIDHIPAAFRH